VLSSGRASASEKGQVRRGGERKERGLERECWGGGGGEVGDKAAALKH
jgi:hypothetical protein